MSNEQNKPAKRSQTTAKPKDKQDKTPPPAPTAEVEANPTPPPKMTVAPVADMQQLWDIAVGYGKTRVFQWDDGKIGCRIEMINTDGVELVAKSDFNHKDPCDALQSAIQRARSIRGISVEGSE